LPAIFANVNGEHWDFDECFRWPLELTTGTKPPSPITPPQPVAALPCGAAVWAKADFGCLSLVVSKLYQGNFCDQLRRVTQCHLEIPGCMKQSSVCPAGNGFKCLCLEFAFLASWGSELQWCFSFDLIKGSCFQGIILIAHIRVFKSSDAPQDATDVIQRDSRAVSSCQMSQHWQQPRHNPPAKIKDLWYFVHARWKEMSPRHPMAPQTTAPSSVPSPGRCPMGPAALHHHGQTPQ